jgi:transcriptional regulator with XRE-family HTH domain
MNKAENYNSPLIEDILNDIPQEEYEKIGKKMLLAARIDDAIKAKGWKKGDFAKMMQKNPSEISKWLSGTHNFTCETLIDIENILDVELILLEKKPLIIKTYVIQVSSPAGMPYADFGSHLRDEDSMRHSYSFKN